MTGQHQRCTDHDAKTMGAPYLLVNPGLAGNPRAAVQIGIDDIGVGKFRSFDTPEALVQHLQKLAADIFCLRKNCTFGSRCFWHPELLQTFLHSLAQKMMSGVGNGKNVDLGRRYEQWFFVKNIEPKRDSNYS